MLKIFETLYRKISPDEAFGDGSNPFPLFLAIVTVVILQLFIGKYLWNNFLVRLIPTVKPVSGLIDILAISFLIRLLFC
jgi:hypothetical protein